MREREGGRERVSKSEDERVSDTEKARREINRILSFPQG